MLANETVRKSQDIFENAIKLGEMNRHSLDLQRSLFAQFKKPKAVKEPSMFHGNNARFVNINTSLW